MASLPHAETSFPREPDPTGEPMLASASALRWIDDSQDQVGRRLKPSALALANEQG